MIDWTAFVIVIASALAGACLVVLLFSLGLRLADGEASWRRPVSRLMFALCGLAALGGVALIVLHALLAA
ncbi:hypothetical protein [Homoserinibacter sp. YIM 151385]|uniref:hypothetical protein n=1 Tax=Homoserinibacter sp. YIM 151385 TaxID=2985506 RepID=UPI0022F03FC2|nr:hypothetical protein [Homoserinibacter sp. YIM 151385]WBU38384.1 hypothetical protein OF852_02015 [Homoserinibacter sp. YIM 151385]